MHRSGPMGSSRLPCRETAGVIKGPYRDAGRAGASAGPATTALSLPGPADSESPWGPPALFRYCCAGDLVLLTARQGKRAVIQFYRGEDCCPVRSGDLPQATQQGWGLGSESVFT